MWLPEHESTWLIWAATHGLLSDIHAATSTPTLLRGKPKQKQNFITDNNHFLLAIFWCFPVYRKTHMLKFGQTLQNQHRPCPLPQKSGNTFTSLNTAPWFVLLDSWCSTFMRKLRLIFFFNIWLCSSHKCAIMTFTKSLSPAPLSDSPNHVHLPRHVYKSLLHFLLIKKEYVNWLCWLYHNPTPLSALI